ncbi:uncharacterized protein LOC117108406 [Anneissia japonica]|uniref:uncharacterized protein LOC117108406 n=1 Tax=Anneissia japonica TaxID=1529436 RepID=UPI001425ACDD|nr:uncharacterized protein LOC117108406 [Anneissia japonica]
MADQLRSIFDDPKYYVKVFDERTKRQQRANALIEWTDDLVVNQLLGKLSVKGRPLKVLGIGSGTGAVEFSNILQLSKKFPLIVTTVLEPAQNHIDEYKKLVEKESITGLTHHWRTQTLHQYRDDVGTSAKFDVIFAVNSLYYVDDVEESLRYMYDILEVGGIMIVIVVAETSGVYKLWKNFSKIYESVSFQKISTSEIMESLSNLNINYQLQRRRNDVDVTECFIEGSQEGQYMIDFLSHVTNLRESIPESLYSEFISFLKEISGPQDGYGEKLWMETSWEAVFVQNVIMTDQLRSIFDDPKYYVKVFDERTKRQQRANALIEWTDELVKNQLIEKLSVKERPLKVLGVGSGTGAVEFSNILQLTEKFPLIVTTVLEPAKNHIDEYRKLVEKESSKLKGITHHWRRQTLNQYRDDVGTSNKFDVIFAVNSLYYVDDVEDSLRYLNDILENGGIMVVIMTAETSGCYRLWKKFSKIYESVCFQKISASEIIENLSNLKINYQLQRRRNDVDVTECFIEDSQEGQYMIDFLSHVINLRGSIPESLYSEFISFLKEISGPQDGYGEKLWMENSWEAVFVQK